MDQITAFFSKLSLDEIEKELMGLGMLLSCLVLLTLTGHLNPDVVEVLKYTGGAFYASTGLQAIMPQKKKPEEGPKV